MGLTKLLISINLFSYTVDTVMVQMRDGVNLVTEICYPWWYQYFPEPSTVLISRTPYPRDQILSNELRTLICDIFNYVLVIQSVRGYQGSQGFPTVFLTDGWGELRDGYDLVEWVKNQSFCNGNIGTFGPSALGITQYMLSGVVHPNLKTLIPWIACHNMYFYAAFPGGEFRKALVENWLNGIGTPFLIDSVCNHPFYDPLWKKLNLNTRLDSIIYPMFHFAGWFDIFLESQIEAFEKINFLGNNFARGKQKLIIGPWGHQTFGQKTQGDLTFPGNADWISNLKVANLQFTWFDYYLKGEINDPDDSFLIFGPRVEFYLMGDVNYPDTTLFNRWYYSDTFPPKGVKYYKFYLHSDFSLTLNPPDLGDTYSSYISRPWDPVPTIGGNEFIGIPGDAYGPKDISSILSRSDVLVFTSPLLDTSYAVVGRPVMVLYASSDALDTDFAIRLADVYPDGRTILIQDNILKARFRHGFENEELLIPNQIDTFYIPLWSTAYVFNKNHRIRIVISSTNYPRFEVNPQTGAPFMRNDPNQVEATNTVYMNSTFPSHILLPLMWPHPVYVKEKEIPDKYDIKFKTLSKGDKDLLIMKEKLPSNTEMELFDIKGSKISLEKSLKSGIYFVLIKNKQIRKNSKIIYLK
ncbi:MAG: CocE/NonD family hydrolase [candidate division WOR-3 bacterium]